MVAAGERHQGHDVLRVGGHLLDAAELRGDRLARPFAQALAQQREQHELAQRDAPVRLHDRGEVGEEGVARLLPLLLDRRHRQVGEREHVVAREDADICVQLLGARGRGRAAARLERRQLAPAGLLLGLEREREHRRLGLRGLAQREAQPLGHVGEQLRRVIDVLRSRVSY